MSTQDMQLISQIIDIFVPHVAACDMVYIIRGTVFKLNWGHCVIHCSLLGYSDHMVLTLFPLNKIYILLNDKIQTYNTDPTKLMDYVAAPGS